MDADWWYAWSSRSGLGTRAAAVGSDVVDDVAAERRELEAVDRLGVGRAGLGELAGDPAHLHDRDARRCSSARSPSGGSPCRRSRMPSAEKASKDSAQSPAWSRNARPSATWARAAVRFRASPANTSGGRPGELLEASPRGRRRRATPAAGRPRGRATTRGPRSRSRTKASPRRSASAGQSGSGRRSRPRGRGTLHKRRSAAPGGRGGRSDRKPGERAVPRLRGGDGGCVPAWVHLVPARWRIATPTTPDFGGYRWYPLRQRRCERGLPHGPRSPLASRAVARPPR